MSASSKHRDGADRIRAAARQLFPDWDDVQAEVIQRGGGATTVGVWRVANTASSSRTARAVAKEIRCLTGDACQRATCEAHVELGFAVIPNGCEQALGRARCLAVERLGNHTFRMWFEDLGSDSANKWSPGIAFAAAKSAAAFSARSPEGSLPCGGYNFLMRYTAVARDAAPAAKGLDTKWRNLLFPGNSEVRARAALDRARPSSPSSGACYAAHQDLNARNLFVDAKGRWSAIDWATFGWAPLGEDLAWLIYGSAFLAQQDLSDLYEFERAGAEGFSAGCADAGVAVSPEALLLRARETACVRLSAYSFLRAPMLASPVTRGLAEKIVGCPVEAFVTRVAQLRDYVHNKTEQ